MKKTIFIYIIIWFSTSILAQNQSENRYINKCILLQFQGVDFDKKHLYKFYFAQDSENSLIKYSKLLEKHGYSNFKFSLDDSGLDTILQVESHEILNAHKLYLREHQFYHLAKENNIEILYLDWEITALPPQDEANINFYQFVEKLDSETLFKWGKTLFEYSMFNEALKIFDSCISRNFKTDTSLIKKAHCYISLKNIPESRKAYEKAIEKHPKLFIAFIGLGDLYISENEFKVAIKYYKKATKILPKDGISVYKIAESYGGLGKNNLAIKYCRKALEKNPKINKAKLLLEYLLQLKKSTKS